MQTTRSLRVAFIGGVVLVSIAFFWLLLPFYGALLWAAVLASLFDPLQQCLVHALRGRKSLAAALSVLACICIVVIPASLLIIVLADDMNSFFQRISQRQFDLSTIVHRIHGALPGPLVDLLGTVDSLEKRLTTAAADGARTVATHLMSIGQGTARFFVGLGLMVYVLFFLFRDGRQLLSTLRSASPLGVQRTSRLIDTVAQVIKATVKGNFIIALIQGASGGIAFWFLGISGALMWGVVMVVLSLLPAIGATLVWAPMAAYLLLSGEYVHGGVLLAVGVFISLIDNFLRPLLVGKEIHLPDYLVLVSTLGGLTLFGMNGFVLGPLIAALFVAVWSLREQG